MSFMLWSEELNTGVDVIDSQHRELVDMLNRAAPVLARSSQDSMQVVGPLLDGLVNYAAVHFRTEEEMMASAGMDARAREHHHATHAGFAEQVARMAQSFSQGLDVTGDRLLSFLASWLVLHILGEDQAMARQFRALANGLPAAQAYAAARGDELQPSPSALSQALVGIYTMHTRQNRELLLANDDLAASRAAIQHHSENLEHLVGLRTVELEEVAKDLRAARDAAQAANRAKTRFLGTMSHELRTPMNTVLGFSRLLQDQGLPAPQQVLAGKVVRASERLLLLLNGIIDYARLERGSQDDADLATFDLAALLGQCSAAGFAAAKAKGLQTGVDIDPGLPRCLRGDAKVIERILQQLIGNAVKFTSSGSIRLSAARLAAEDDAAPRLRVSVSDTGIGIPQSIQARLFQPFMQADDGAARKFEGIGLGLALARELAHLLGAEVGLTSEPGQGSRFTICLPWQPG
jgi:hemerythrin-like metal-binding protein